MKRKDLPEYTNEKVDMLIDQHIHSERNRQILKLCLIDGVAVEKVAERFDLCDKTIYNVLHAGMKTIIKYI